MNHKAPRPPSETIAFALALAALVAWLIATLELRSGIATLHVLQKAAGYTPGKSSVHFSGLEDYLSNLQSAILPLALPAAMLGLTAAGVAYWIGQQWAQRALAAIVIGLGIALTSPQILQ